jgi:hypothetical protein
MADDEDCRRKHFLVLSTFNEEQYQEGQPALHIPGALFWMKRDHEYTKTRIQTNEH